jgi:hypothetical protein
VQHAVERPSRERTTCNDAYGSDSGANHESLALDISPLFAVAIARCAFSCSVGSCCCTGTFAAVASWNALAMLVATTSFQNCWIGARRQTSFDWNRRKVTNLFSTRSQQRTLAAAGPEGSDVQRHSQIRRATKDVAKRKTREGNSARIATASGANRDSSLQTR